MNHRPSDYRPGNPHYAAMARRLGYLLGVGILAGTLTSGCINHEEKARKVISQAVQACRDAPADGPFYAVKSIDKSQDEILRIVCSQEIEKFEIKNNLVASAYTGPARWDANLEAESKTWVLGGVEWSDLDRARRALEDSDPSEEQLGYAIQHLSAAQQDVPASEWIRMTKLESLLRLRAKTRGTDKEHPETIGPDAQTYYEQTLAWADESQNLNARVQAQYLVASHLRDYLRRVDMILDVDPSSDEWLVKSAEQARQEGDKAKADEYLKELEETRARREESQEIFSKRRVAVREGLCEQLAKLSPAGVTDDALQQRVSAIKSSTDCVERAAQAD